MWLKVDVLLSICVAVLDVLLDVLHLLRLRLLRSCLQCRRLLRIARRWLPRVHVDGSGSRDSLASATAAGPPAGGSRHESAQVRLHGRIKSLVCWF